MGTEGGFLKKILGGGKDMPLKENIVPEQGPDYFKGLTKDQVLNLIGEGKFDSIVSNLEHINPEFLDDEVMNRILDRLDPMQNFSSMNHLRFSFEQFHGLKNETKLKLLDTLTGGDFYGRDEINGIKKKLGISDISEIKGIEENFKN